MVDKQTSSQSFNKASESTAESAAESKINDDAFNKLQDKNQELFSKVKALEILLEEKQKEFDNKAEEVSKLMNDATFYEQRLEE